MSLQTLFDGQPLFGNESNLVANFLPGPSAAGIDTYLSLSPGTTKFGASDSGKLIGVSGSFTGTTSAAVSAESAALTAFAGISGSFVLSPGTVMTGGVNGVLAAYFTSTDVVLGSVTGSGSSWAQTYILVLRVLAGGQIAYPIAAAPSTGAIAASSLVGNPTATVANPSAITLGSGLSFSGTTLVAAGSGGTPGGSSGQVQFNSSSVFAGASDLAIGTDGNLAFTPLSHGSPALGDLWYASGDQNTFVIGRASGPARLGGCIFSCGPCNSVNTTATATSIFGTPTLVPAGASLTIPANTLKVGNVLRWLMSGVWGATASSPTIAFTVLLNGVAILASEGTSTLPNAQTAAPFFNSSGYINIQAIGASAKASGLFAPLLANVGFGNVGQTCVPGGGAGVGSITFASNTNALFDIQVLWSASSASNTMTLQSFQLFLDN